MDHPAVMYAFWHFFHMDKANACMHQAPVKFSPITFGLANTLNQMGYQPSSDSALAEVHAHTGTYELDPGR